eukprot:1195608-Prorocentrum_minimum.AAC.2
MVSKHIFSGWDTLGHRWDTRIQALSASAPTTLRQAGRPGDKPEAGGAGGKVAAKQEAPHTPKTRNLGARPERALDSARHGHCRLDQRDLKTLKP